MKNLPVTVTDEEVEAMLRSFSQKKSEKYCRHNSQNWSFDALFDIIRAIENIDREADKNGDGELDLAEFKIMMGI